MLVIMKNNALEEDILSVKQNLMNMGLEPVVLKGFDNCVIGVRGNVFGVEAGNIELFAGVERIIRLNKPYKLAGRQLHKDNTVVNINGHNIGGKKLAIIGGPCTVENYNDTLDMAKKLKSAGAAFLRGGAFKPRLSPYSFQGLENEGLEILYKAGKATNMPVVCEILSVNHIELYKEKADIIQIGARNMQNYDLLKALAKTDKPVLLKRGLSNTLEEWLMSAEYILMGGNPNVILCERGIRTFEKYTRNTLDISAIPAIKKLSHLPVIVDPSHCAGIGEMVAPLSMAAIAAGADGLIIEMHNDPQKALCDGQQAINAEDFSNIILKLKSLAKLMEREL